MNKVSVKYINRINLRNAAGVLGIVSLLLALLGGYQELTITIEVQWKTASQLNLVGFNLLRSEGDEDSFLPINSAMITIQGDRVIGSQYLFVDKQVQPGRIYYYKIEEITLQGAHEVIGQTKVEANHPGGLAMFFSGIFAFLAVATLWIIKNHSQSAED